MEKIIIPEEVEAPGRDQDAQIFGGAVPSQLTENKEDATSKGPKKAGTLFGVFFPCTQNILGIIIFLRLPWV